MSIEHEIHLAKTAKHYDDEAESYDEGYSSPLNKAEDVAVVTLLRPLLEGNILDVGCGTGLVLDYFGDAIPPDRYIGLDLSMGMASIARQKFSDYTFLQADMDRLPVPSESQDTIVSTFGPFSYSLDPSKTISEFLRILKPGGKLAVMPYSLRVAHGIGVEGYSTAIEQAVEKRFYTSQELCTLFSCFEYVKLHGINFIGNFIEQLGEAFSDPLSVEVFQQLLHLDAQMQALLPVEYARHIMVVAQKGNT